MATLMASLNSNRCAIRPLECPDDHGRGVKPGTNSSDTVEELPAVQPLMMNEDELVTQLHRIDHEDDQHERVALVGEELLVINASAPR